MNDHSECLGCQWCPTRLKGLFGGLSQESLEELDSTRRLRRVEKGELIFRQGEQSRNLFCIHTGKVKLYRTTPAGELQILGLIGPGDPMGHRAFFAEEPFDCSAEAVSVGEICCLDRPTLIKLSEDEPDLMHRLIDRLTDELRHTEGRLVDAIHRTVRERVASLLLDLAPEDSGRVETPFSRLELAQMVGTTPETMARILSDFHRLGAIRRTRRTIRVDDREKLGRLAGH